MHDACGVLRSCQIRNRMGEILIFGHKQDKARELASQLDSISAKGKLYNRCDNTELYALYFGVSICEECICTSCTSFPVISLPL